MSYQIIQVTHVPKVIEEVVKDKFKTESEAQIFLDKLARKQGWTQRTSATEVKYVDSEERIYFVRSSSS